MPREILKTTAHSITVYWSAYATALVFLVGFILWLVFSWHLFIGGFHMHHFPLGLLAVFCAVFSLLLQGFSSSMRVKNPVGRGSYAMNLHYNTIPLISSIIYIVIAGLLIWTDWADFATWLSNPLSFNWSA